jgi:hypothetical protein
MICSAVWVGSVEKSALGGHVPAGSASQDPAERYRIVSVARPIQGALLPGGVRGLQHLLQGGETVTSDPGTTTGLPGACGRWLVEDGIHPASCHDGSLLSVCRQPPFQDTGGGLAHERDATARTPSAHQTDHLMRLHAHGLLPLAQVFTHLGSRRQHIHGTAQGSVIWGRVTTTASTRQRNPGLLATLFSKKRAISRE